MRALIAYLGMCLLGDAAIAADDEGLSLMRVPFERGSQTPPAVSVFFDRDYGGIGSKRPPHAVIACIWPDGRAVWSRDRTEGGPPYFTGRVDAAKLTEFISSLETKGIFARKVWYSVGVDASHHDINIIDGQRRVALETTGYYYSKKSNVPPQITEIADAVGFVRSKLERLRPRQGEQLREFNYELRPIK
jgi:hypothetical protein